MEKYDDKHHAHRRRDALATVKKDDRTLKELIDSLQRVEDRNTRLTRTNGLTLQGKDMDTLTRKEKVIDAMGDSYRKENLISSSTN